MSCHQTSQKSGWRMWPKYKSQTSLSSSSKIRRISAPFGTNSKSTGSIVTRLRGMSPIGCKDFRPSTILQQNGYRSCRHRWQCIAQHGARRMSSYKMNMKMPYLATSGKPHWESYEKGKKICPTDFISHIAADKKSRPDRRLSSVRSRLSSSSRTSRS